MTYRRRPTRRQVPLLVLMAAAFSSLLAWAIPEIRGIIDPAAEDTYSEWVWDLPAWAMLTVAALHLVAGVLFVWSSIHFVEGWAARR